MSTEYYRLRPPITSLRLEEGPSHDRLSIWERHGLAGVLTITAGAGREIAYRLANTDEDGVTCPLHVSAGPVEVGVVVTVNDPNIPDDATVVSDSGEVTTVRAVKALAGRGAS